MTTGYLLVNLGTPASTRVADVRAYLGEFLTDPYVISLPTPLRQILVRAAHLINTGIVAPVVSAGPIAIIPDVGKVGENHLIVVIYKVIMIKFVAERVGDQPNSVGGTICYVIFEKNVGS